MHLIFLTHYHKQDPWADTGYCGTLRYASNLHTKPWLFRYSETSLWDHGGANITFVINIFLTAIYYRF